MKPARVILWTILALPSVALGVLWVWGVVANVQVTGFGR